MKSILNNKKAEIGYAKMVWAVLIMSLVFGIFVTLIFVTLQIYFKLILIAIVFLFFFKKLLFFF